MLFSSAFNSDKNMIEGHVSYVDPQNFTCVVISVSNQYLRDVIWTVPVGGNSNSGSCWSPSIGDKVLVCTSLSSPTIIGCLPRMGIPDGTEATISEGALGVSTKTADTLKNGNVLNPGKPSDFSQDDKVLYTKGGGLLAVLSTGGILAKASAVSQIFLSKFEGLVRIVGRNFYRFSDSSSEVAANVKGRLYHWFGADKSLDRGLVNAERYNEAYGDIPAAEAMRGQPSPFSSPAAADSRVKKIWLNNTDSFSVMVETLYEDGALVTKVTTNDASGSSTITHTNSQVKLDVRNSSGYSIIDVVPGSIKLDHKGIATATLTDSSSLYKHGEHQMLIDDTGVHLS